jgi:hypothetical protein
MVLEIFGGVVTMPYHLRARATKVLILTNSWPWHPSNRCCSAGSSGSKSARHTSQYGRGPECGTTRDIPYQPPPIVLGVRPPVSERGGASPGSTVCWLE